jgi:uncharacterized protein (TIGR02996 family)
VPENPALFAAIIAHPAEDTPRLAYADWLDENGDPTRARFIRLQYEIEKLPPIGAKASKAKKEEEALLKKHEKQWAGEVAQLVDLARFRRGFIEWVRVTPAQFLQHAGRLFELAPIRMVRFEKTGPHMPALVASPHFGRAEGVGFSAYIMDQLGHDGRFEALIAAPALARIRRLDLNMSSLDQRHAAQIARCPYLGAVEHLDLSYNSFNSEGMRAILHTAPLPALRSLTIRGNGQVGENAMRVIVDSPLADRLEHLDLGTHWFGDEPVRILAGAPRLKRLLTLDLSDNKITDAGARVLAASPQLNGLQRLILRGHRKTLGAPGREQLKKRFGKDACVF